VTSVLISPGAILVYAVSTSRPCRWRLGVGQRPEHQRRQLRADAGLRLIAGFSFVSLLRFEVVTDLAVPLDARGRREEAGLQAWVRLQSTVGGGVH